MGEALQSIECIDLVVRCIGKFESHFNIRFEWIWSGTKTNGKLMDATVHYTRSLSTKYVLLWSVKLTQQAVLYRKRTPVDHRPPISGLKRKLRKINGFGQAFLRIRNQICTKKRQFIFLASMHNSPTWSTVSIRHECDWMLRIPGYVSILTNSVMKRWTELWMQRENYCKRFLSG